LRSQAGRRQKRDARREMGVTELESEWGVEQRERGMNLGRQIKQRGGSGGSRYGDFSSSADGD
jgi:hypothetical protein